MSDLVDEPCPCGCSDALGCLTDTYMAHSIEEKAWDQAFMASLTDWRLTDPGIRS